MARNLGILNNISAVILPYLGWPLGIILFKLYFEGVRIELAVIQNMEDQTERNRRKRKINTSTVYMIIFVAVIVFIINVNELLLPLSMISNQAAYTLNMVLLMISGQFAMNYGILLASVFISFRLVLILGVLFLFLQIVFFPDMKIIRTK
jgi:ABC-type glycerol-3-phosphate transport system permease component